MKCPRTTLCLLALGLAIAGNFAAAQTRPTPERAQIERRLQSVATLINESSAARQIDSSGVPAARERRDNARLIHREAQTTLAAGDLDHANKLLDQAAREMMQGARLANPEQVAGEKDKRDYELRLDSARALLAAQQRITQEKSAGREAQDAARSIEQQIAEGEKLAAQGRYDAARPAIDRAYLTARVSIESMRRGDTLVRSLHFASKREEFDYEVDRNETHRMLINVLMADRKDPAGAMPPGMQAAIEKAAALRQQADAMGQRGDHEGAIKMLEDSTRELVRAIRAGGLYIPG
jgi:tetratricopeptide (TPR) repeat protein